MRAKFFASIVYRVIHTLTCNSSGLDDALEGVAQSLFLCINSHIRLEMLWMLEMNNKAFIHHLCCIHNYNPT